MDGFKKFLLRGNLVDIAVAFIIATSFATVVKTFTDTLMGFIGKVFDQPDFGAAEIADVNVGLFINAVIGFVILSAIVYFFVVTPYTKAKERYFPDEPEAEAPDIVLLTQIRDSLQSR